MYMRIQDEIRTYLTFGYVQQGYSVIIVISMLFSQFFHAKPTLRWILDAPKFLMPFLGQSLLLST